MSATTHLRSFAHGALTLLLIASAAACERERSAPARTSGAAQQGTSALPADVRPAPDPPARYGFGHRASAAEIRAWDIDVGPDGRELPPGRGTYERGVAVFREKCAMCHGAKGEGMGQGHAAFPRLIGREPREGFPFGQDFRHVKTIGNYWPYATTVFDYVRRAMPLTAPGSLSNDDTYSLVAFLLAENEIVGRGTAMDARTLREVRMPARDHFVPDDRRGGPEVR